MTIIRSNIKKGGKSLDRAKNKVGTETLEKT
jgi:hypothetical protein